jgi:transposase
MFPISSQSRFLLYLPPTDMRKSFDSLQGLVNNHLPNSPLSGTVYIFINKRRDRIKMLVWDGDGFWLFYKRLEKGRFQTLPARAETGLEMPYELLVMLLQGIDISGLKRRLRYQDLSTKSLV